MLLKKKYELALASIKERYGKDAVIPEVTLEDDERSDMLKAVFRFVLRIWK
jgi:hypothetical protein